MQPTVGDVLRDRQYDDRSRSVMVLTKRTIRVLEVGADFIMAQAVTGYDGQPAKRAPRRRISFKTLASCYEPVANSDSQANDRHLDPVRDAEAMMVEGDAAEQ